MANPTGSLSAVGARVPRQQGRPPLPDGHPRLGLALQALLVIDVLVGLAAVGIQVWSVVTVSAMGVDPDSVTDRTVMWLDLSVLGVRGAALLAFAATAVTLLPWLHQAYTAREVDEDALRHEPAWALAGWFVPVLSWFYPVEVMLDLLRGACPRERSLPRWSHWVAVGWWGAFHAGYALLYLALWIERALDPVAPDALDQLTDASWLAGVGWALGAVSAGLLLVLVRRITLELRASTALVLTSTHANAHRGG